MKDFGLQSIELKLDPAGKTLGRAVETEAAEASRSATGLMLGELKPRGRAMRKAQAKNIERGESNVAPSNKPQKKWIQSGNGRPRWLRWAMIPVMTSFLLTTMVMGDGTSALRLAPRPAIGLNVKAAADDLDLSMAAYFGEFADTNARGLWVSTTTGTLVHVTANPSADDP